MKTNFFLLFCIIFQFSFAQETENNIIKFNPKVSFGPQTQYFFGNNYLSRGHKNPSIGVELDFQIMSYSKFNLGIGAKKTTLSVVNKAIGGNIDKSNLNLWYGFISYILYKKNKILVSPQFSLGEIYIRQKDGSKLYGVQKGNHFSIDIKSIFLINKNFKVYSKIGFTEFFLRTKTSKEFENYFNQTHSINLSLGLEF